jgi:hypothetical protein
MPHHRTHVRTSQQQQQTLFRQQYSCTSTRHTHLQTSQRHEAAAAAAVALAAAAAAAAAASPAKGMAMLITHTAAVTWMNSLQQKMQIYTSSLDDRGCKLNRCKTCGSTHCANTSMASAPYMP